MDKNEKTGNIIALVTMIFLFGMVGFVTNLASPVGNIWKMQPGIDGSNTLGMMGNMMNFLAYLFMGVPAGKIFNRQGAKKTSILAVGIGFWGIFIQYLSGVIGVNPDSTGIPASWYVYLLGAFVCGFCVCLLNTVVNPMLSFLGGGGNKGNQYVQMGAACNSLMATLTPMIVGALVGSLTPQTRFDDINILLYIGMGVFALVGIILMCLDMVEPETVKEEDSADSPKPWKYPHFVFGIVAAFFYVGAETGIPGTLNFYLSDPSKGKRIL